MNLKVKEGYRGMDREGQEKDLETEESREVLTLIVITACQKLSGPFC